MRESFCFWGIGVIKKKPELRYSKEGRPWVFFPIEFVDEFGSFKFHSCKAWDKIAEIISTKEEGDAICIEGRPRWENWKDKGGNEHWTLTLHINKLIENEDEGKKPPEDLGFGTPGEVEDVPF